MTSVTRAAAPAVPAQANDVPPTDLEQSLAPLMPLFEAIESLPAQEQEAALALLEGIITLPPEEQEARFTQLDAIFAKAQGGSPMAKDDFQTPGATAPKGMPSLVG